MKKRKIVVVSLFSGMDLFLFACVKAGLIPGYACERNIYAALMHAPNFHHADGSPLIEFVNITQEEYFLRKGQKELEDTCTEKDGQYIRAKTVEEVNGFDIRSSIEKEYGSDVIIILIGGPPCQDLISFNPSRNSGFDGDPTSRNFLMFQYLRLLKELDPDIAFCEQSTEIGTEKNSHILNRFISQIRQLPFRVAYLDMNSIHFLGNQSRLRRVFLFVSERLNKMPVFPIPMPEKAKRVRDFLDIDRFHSGHFTDRIKTKNDFMCTVTSGSPLWFFKDQRKWHPTTDELLWCDDVKPGEYIIPSDIPTQQVKKALGNVVVVSTGYAVITTVLEKVLRLKPDGDGYWIPIDDAPDEPLPPDDGGGGNVPTSDGGGDTTSPVGSGGNPLPDSGADSTTPVLNEQGLQAIVVEAVPVPNIPLPPEKTLALPKPKLYHESGFKLYEGKSQINGDNIVAILTLESANTKTGNMAQLWILNADVSPLDAVSTGKDEAVCGQCNFRHYKNGACYVTVAKSPQTVWRAWKNSAYPRLRTEFYKKYLTEKSIRIGAYGDPYALPLHLLTELKKYATNHTCYTHQWKEESAQALKPLSMASVDSPEEYTHASNMGWRTFRVKHMDDPLMPGEIQCPNETRGVQCKDCRLCSGTSIGAKNIAINVHGSNMNKFDNEAVAATEGGQERQAGGEVLVPEPKAAVVAVEPQVTINTQPVDAPQTRVAMPPVRNIIIANTSSKKIITSLELINMQFQWLNFEGRWLDFFGLPSLNFCCVIYGSGGNGKSTFSIQFADYLALNFGRTVYISGEEGISMTSKNKFVITNAGSELLHVADLRNFDDIRREIRANAYNFILIDSLDTMKINAGKMKELRSAYKNSAIIAIAQTTKAGAMRGSNELIFDPDIVVNVGGGGIATTTKNRFKEKGTTFNVFEKVKDVELANGGVTIQQNRS